MGVCRPTLVAPCQGPSDSLLIDDRSINHSRIYHFCQFYNYKFVFVFLKKLVFAPYYSSRILWMQYLIYIDVTILSWLFTVYKHFENLNHLLFLMKMSKMTWNGSGKNINHLDSIIRCLLLWHVKRGVKLGLTWN